MKRIILILILAIVALAGAWYFLNNTEIVREKLVIDDTANQITEIKRLGQWEFLAVECEVLVDTVRPRSFFMTDDRLARIYKGTMRLGINVENAPDGWISVQGDSAVTIQLPAVKLLDDKFIDEAATVAFYQDGDWDGQAKEDMYTRAKARMLAIGMTDANIALARKSAVQRFETLFHAIGFKDVKVSVAE